MKNTEAIFPTHTMKSGGAYSPAIRAGNMVFISGQLPLNLDMIIVSEEIAAQIHQAFRNLKLVCEASGGSLNQIVKLTIYLTDMIHYALLNQIMSEYFSEPYPARAVIGVRQLPRDVQVEVEGVMYCGQHNEEGQIK